MSSGSPYCSTSSGAKGSHVGWFICSSVINSTLWLPRKISHQQLDNLPQYSLPLESDSWWYPGLSSPSDREFYLYKKYLHVIWHQPRVQWWTISYIVFPGWNAVKLVLENPFWLYLVTPSTFFSIPTLLWSPHGVCPFWLLHNFLLKPGQIIKFIHKTINGQFAMKFSIFSPAEDRLTLLILWLPCARKKYTKHIKKIF